MMLCAQTDQLLRSRCARIQAAAASSQPGLRSIEALLASIVLKHYSLEHAVRHDAVCEVQLILLDERHPVLLFYVPAA
jgi:hypothetical protein